MSPFMTFYDSYIIHILFLCEISIPFSRPADGGPQAKAGRQLGPESAAPFEVRVWKMWKKPRPAQILQLPKICGEKCEKCEKCIMRTDLSSSQVLLVLVIAFMLGEGIDSLSRTRTLVHDTGVNKSWFATCLQNVCRCWRIGRT